VPIHQLIQTPASGGSGLDLPEPTTPECPAQSPSPRLPKQKPNLEPEPEPSPVDGADDYVYIIKSKGIPTMPNGHDAGHPAHELRDKHETALRPIRSPRSSSKWLFPLELTLEELFHGTSLRFRITSRLLNHKTKQSRVAIDIPPGTLAGTKIRCPGVGHERTDGTYQDVILVVEEKLHDRFQRVEDDLFLEVFVPPADHLATEGGDIFVEGIDGTTITVHIPYPVDQTLTEGKVVVEGAGMPFRRGRGDMIVKWQVIYPSLTSKWDTVKKVLHMPCS